jgi:hypothetical protein
MTTRDSHTGSHRQHRLSDQVSANTDFGQSQYPQAQTDRWLARHKNVHFHFTPTHASWLNQVEVWFSILSAKALASLQSNRSPL